MILQKIVFPDRKDGTEKLYYRGNGVHTAADEDTFVMNQNGVMDMITYFNGFSAGKWRKYTKVTHLDLTIDFCGHISVSVYHKKKVGSTIVSRIIYRMDVSSKERTSQTMYIGSLPSEGIIGFVLTSKQDNSCFFGGFYGTRERLDVKDVHIGIGICTFKREAYVKRNMQILKAQILDNPEALSRGHFTVCIADNAQTLTKETFEHPDIRLVMNKNLGGVGGFTRTIIEHMNGEKTLTHVLLMDDDAMISPASLERTYTFLTLLKPRYAQYVLGGALIRLDQPTIQHESGARWNRGDIQALKMDYDLSCVKDIVKNEIEERVEYTGWWYSCIPVSQIEKSKLPLPLFLHRDDIEYGLRAEGFILLNGICVWHESFQNKLPGVVEYYDIRNMGIINAIHYADYDKKSFKKQLFIAVSSNIGKYRYKYVSLNLKGAVDFLKGYEWFSKADTIEIHKELARYNYTSRPVMDYVGYHGLDRNDLENYTEEEAVPPLLVRLFRIASMNGTFFPSKGKKPAVVIPWPNIYELYRKKEVIYVDNNGNGTGVKRSRKNLIRAYIQLFKVFRMIDRQFDDACRGYRENYDQLISREFWNKYLNITEED